MKGILGSVGRNGKNIRQDIILVQELLNKNISSLPKEKSWSLMG
jgi:hypothetical protein